MASDSDGVRPGVPGPAGRGTRRLSRPLRLLLPAAVLLPLLVFATGAWLTWQDTMRSAERELTRGADAVAEASLRMIDGFRLATDLVNYALRGLSDEQIRARLPALRGDLRALVPPLPGLLAILVIDRDAHVLIDTQGETSQPEISLADREYVRAMQDPAAPPLHFGAVSIGRVRGRLFFPISRRRTGSGNGLPADAYDGVIAAAVDPNLFAQGFAALAGEAGDTGALVRQDGAVLVRSSGLAEPPTAVPTGSALFQLMTAGVQRRVYTGNSLPPAPAGETRRIAARRVGDLPLYATMARTTPRIRRTWLEALLVQLAIGLPAWLALSCMAWLAVQRARRADEAEAALREETARRAAAEAAAASEARFRAVFDSAVTGKAVFDLHGNRVIEVNPKLLELTGAARGTGAADWDWRRVTPPEHLPQDEAALAEARSQGWWRPYEKEYRRPDGTLVPVRISSAPLPGEPGRLVVMVQDISEQRAAEARRDLLSREVDHRAKNALAVVQAAVRLTPRDDAQAYAQAVEGRVAALARAHTLLSEGRWEGTALRLLAEGELAPFVAAARVTLDGPEVVLLPVAVQSLSMTLHELATNAVKHGALGAADGRLEITWWIDAPAGMLRLRWQEIGGPAVREPLGRSGFGARVIEATMRNQLGGNVTRLWEATGLVCTIEVPVARAVAPLSPAR